MRLAVASLQLDVLNGAQYKPWRRDEQIKCSACAPRKCSHMSPSDVYDVRCIYAQMLEENRRLAIWTHWMDGTSPLHAATCEVHFAKRCLRESSRYARDQASAQAQAASHKDGLYICQHTCARQHCLWTLL